MLVRQKKLAVAFFVAATAGCSLNTHPHLAGWATQVTRTGLPNLHRIDAGLYRGAQPRSQGIAELRDLGVRTIVNVRPSQYHQAEILEAGLTYEHLPTRPWSLNEEDITEFLRVAKDSKRRPVFVHCHHGADRSGALCAAYRIVVQGWSKEEALLEMTAGPFGFHSLWRGLVDTIQDLPVEQLRAELHIEPTSESILLAKGPSDGSGLIK